MTKTLQTRASQVRPSHSLVASRETPRHYRYVIEGIDPSGQRLGPLPVDPDFQPAREWTALLAARSGRRPIVTAAAEGRISPVWSEERGEPYCQGIRVDAADPGPESGDASTATSCEFPLSYFATLAKQCAATWIERGDLRPGEHYVWFLCAYGVATAAPVRRPALATGAVPTDRGADFDVESLVEAVPVVDSALDVFRQRAKAFGTGHPADFPVFFHQGVLDEASELATRAGETETGGALVGHIHRDLPTSEIFIEIVAQIPARFAEATSASFSFTSETWAAADAAIALRGQGELLLGFWHSHPRFCHPECPPERQRTCPFARPFFSPDDIHLHRVCFPQAYQVALLISDLPNLGTTPAVFGWRSGCVEDRGYCVLP